MFSERPANSGAPLPSSPGLQQRGDFQRAKLPRDLYAVPSLGTRQYARILGHSVDELGLDPAEAWSSWYA
ncbi:hypothetical protein FFI97_025040 [Variovorax sp. KBS0712]|nr:hypothetical protein FFI97_025040 [Variovorax sp. KBS0712]